MERVDPEFLRYIWSFRRTQRGKILGLLQAFEGQVITLHNRRETRQWLDNL